MNMAKKIRYFAKNNQIDYLHIHDIQIAGAAIQICDELRLQFTLDLHENRPEIMKHYKHVNSFFGKLLINPNSWKIAEEKFIKKLEKRMQTLNVGNPLDKNTDVGAINSKDQLDKIEKLVNEGVAVKCKG